MQKYNCLRFSFSLEFQLKVCNKFFMRKLSTFMELHSFEIRGFDKATKTLCSHALLLFRNCTLLTLEFTFGSFYVNYHFSYM